ncbi:hypothetical protein Ndes2437B_g07135 [Nannochloris sp. 'desiccata']
MLPRSRSSAKRAIALLERSISSSKHTLKQTKGTSASSGYVRSQPKVELPPDAKATPAAMPKPPSLSAGAPPSSGAVSSSASSSSSWQLNPSIPVDVRLLGAGALGAGALLYSLSGSGDGDDPDKKKSIGEAGHAEENVFVIQDESTSQVEATKQPEDSDSHYQQSKLETPSSAGEPDGTAPQTEEEEGGESLADGKEEPAIVKDSHEVLKMIEDVLSKPAEQMLSEDAAAVKNHDANDIAKTSRHNEEDVQAAQVAITSAMSENAAESISSDIVKASKGVDAMNPSSSSSSSHKKINSRSPEHHGRPTKEPSWTSPSHSPSSPTPVSDSLASASATLAGVSPDVMNILGLHADLTAAGLLSDAVKNGVGPGDNWEEYAYRHKQAESDAEILASLLDSAAQHVKKQITAAQAAARAGRTEAEEIKKEAAAQAELFRDALRDALKKAEEGHRVQMNQQAEKLANAHAEMTVRERVERQKIVDDLRKKLGALERALEKRGDAARGSTRAHRMAQGAFALQEVLDKGGKVDGAVEYLTTACGSDPLISAAARALPRGKRILTPTQLTDEFDAVERVAKELSLLPAGHGGMLSAAVAKMVSKLKLKEKPNSYSQVLNGNGTNVGIDAKLGEIEAEVVNGRYTQAAKNLEEAVQGTAAALAVKDWVEAVRARAAAEQAVAVVEAHAATAALSLA